MVPTFADYLRKAYLPALAASGKRPASVAKEKHQLERWAAELGHVRLNKLGPGHLDAVLVKLSNEGLFGRTVNLYVIAARNFIKAAARDRHCQRPQPFEGIVWRKWDRKSRSLVTPEEIERLINAAVTHLPRRGHDLADYIRFLQFTGCREKEALAIRWGDVDAVRGVLTIGARGETKNRSPRHLPMNPQLRTLLTELTTRRAPDSDLLFPSPRRGDGGESGEAGGSVRAALGKARLKAKLPKFGLHDLRHHFASHAVMGGVDFATLARWLGHRDGGALLARTYAHMTESHERQLADRLNLGGPVLVRNLYAHTGNAIVKRYPDGRKTLVAGKIGEAGYANGPGPLARFSGIGGIAAASPTILLVADTGNHRIRRVFLQAETGESPFLTGALLFGVTVQGLPGREYRLERADAVGAPWSGITNFIMPGPSFLWVSPNLTEYGIFRSVVVR